MHRQSRWFVIAKRLLFGFSMMIALGLGVRSWTLFHPSLAVEFIGPAGVQNRAFVENRSLRHVDYTLCVSDWPYTFVKPVFVESVMYSEGADCRVFWSADGSVVVARDSDSSQHRAAYDFAHHELIRGDADRIQILVDARGGLGPEFSDYRDGKETYDR